MTSLVSAEGRYASRRGGAPPPVVTGQVQSLDSVRAHALPSDAMIFAKPSPS